MTTITVHQVTLDPEMARKLRQAGRKLDEWKLERDRLILEAHAAGAGYREIGRAVGLSHVGVKGVVEGKFMVEELLDLAKEKLPPDDEDV